MHCEYPPRSDAEFLPRLFLQSFQNGGSAGSIYGFIIVWIGTLSVFATMGELASM